MINLSQGYILNLAFSTSYICLFIVLTLYKYEVMFRNGVLLVALFGPLYPQIYLLPYFFIVWRVHREKWCAILMFIGVLKQHRSVLFKNLAHLTMLNHNHTAQ